MKIGILTFHWATNYGAILQAYALQEHLRELGNEVEIINYKPRQYNFSYLNFVRRPQSIIHYKRVMFNRRKEDCLANFRNKYLNQTRRCYTYHDVCTIVGDYDVLISGSDQILNPAFTLHGEGHKTPVYYLNFPDSKAKKIGYAVSFGCTQYPENAESFAREWIQSFDKIGVRENTGLDILKQLGYEKERCVLPDPTVLRGIKLFKDIALENYSSKGDYTCVYMLRRQLKYPFSNAVIIDEAHEIYTMEQWLGLIRQAKLLITNSYHGMIMAILFHVPFFIDIETQKGVGMNDRFYTLLGKLGLVDRIVNGNFDKDCENKPIDWDCVDKQISAFRNTSEEFLNM